MTAKHSSLVCWAVEAGVGAGGEPEAGAGSGAEARAGAEAWSDAGESSPSFGSLKASMVMRRSTWVGFMQILNTDRWKINLFLTTPGDETLLPSAHLTEGHQVTPYEPDIDVLHVGGGGELRHHLNIQMKIYSLFYIAPWFFSS